MLLTMFLHISALAPKSVCVVIEIDGSALCLQVSLVLLTIKYSTAVLYFLYIFGFLSSSKAARCSFPHVMLDCRECRHFGKGCSLVSSASASATAVMVLQSSTSD